MPTSKPATRAPSVNFRDIWLQEGSFTAVAGERFISVRPTRPMFGDVLFSQLDGYPFRIGIGSERFRPW